MCNFKSLKKSRKFYSLGIVLSTMKSYEPATGAELWTGQIGDVDAEVARAREAWGKWAAYGLSDRIETVRKFSNRLKSDAEPLIDLISRETGKPIWESRDEVETIISMVNMSIKAYAERSSQRRLNGTAGSSAALRHKPRGLFAVITAYNEPAAIPCGHIIPALLAGNAVIFKPSEYAPAVGQFIVDCLHSAGIPKDIVRIVHGGSAIGAALAVHKDIDGLFFTGSAYNGIQINRQFVNRPGKMLSLEMGGNNPIIFWDTTDIYSAAAIVVKSAFLSAGQKCTSARRLIVKHDLYDSVIAEIKRLADRLIINDPHGDPPPFMGPLISNDAADGLTESFLALMSHGGRPIRHMSRPIKGRPFVSPGIIDVTNMQERPDLELFGPLLQVIRVSSFDDAITEANNTRFGLSASLLGGNAEQYNQFWANSRAGIVNWNAETNKISIAAPMGGIGLSGNGRPSAFYSADHCAYPVASEEHDVPKAMIGIGLKDDDYGSDNSEENKTAAA